LDDFGEGSLELRGELASESGTNIVDVLEKLDTIANDSGKEEYEVRTEPGTVSNVDVYELCVECGCNSFVEL
jgi:hypothetical protein